MATVKVTNKTGNEYSVKGIIWSPFETKKFVHPLPSEIISVIEAGVYLSADVDVTPFGSFSDLPAVTCVTGTAVEEDNGSIDIVAITDVATAANAIQTLVSCVNALTAQVNALRAEAVADNEA